MNPSLSPLATIGVALIDKLPAILTAIGVAIGAFLTLRNGHKTDENTALTVEAGNKADVASAKAESAAQAVVQVHETAKAIEAQTNGHLSRLTLEISRLTLINEALQQTIVTLSGLLAARPAAVIEVPARQVRRTDVAGSE